MGFRQLTINILENERSKRDENTKYQCKSI